MSSRDRRLDRVSVRRRRGVSVLRGQRFDAKTGTLKLAKLAIFVDGGYLSYLAEHHFRTWVDFGKLSNQVTNTIAERTEEPLDLLRTYFYDCLPYQSSTPTEDEERRFSSKKRFFYALQRLPRYKVREGRLMHRGIDSQGKPIFQQKRVDLMVGLDIASLAAKRQINHAAVISGDGDLMPAVEAAQQEGVLVWLVHARSSPTPKSCGTSPTTASPSTPTS